jgi:hypothetical protein
MRRRNFLAARPETRFARHAITLSPEQLAALNEPSTPFLNFPAAVITEMTPTFAFGGATVDVVELPVRRQLLTSSARY